MSEKDLWLLGIFMCGVPLVAQEAPDQFWDPGAREENYTMRITARVIDEAGKPIPHAPIRIGVHNVNDYKDGYNDFRGEADAEGKFSAESVGRGLADVEVKMDGYYISRKTATCYKGSPEEIRKGGRFLPWDPVVDISVRKIGNPIPMRVWIPDTDGSHRAPGMDEEFGFDLYEKDWVKPHGKGTQPDLMVKFASDFISTSDYRTSCSIRFPNPDDGFIPMPELVNPDSRLKFPRVAPVSGYELQSVRFESNYREGEIVDSIVEEMVGYLIRFRTVRDEQTGQISSAIYGKIVMPQKGVPPFQLHPYMSIDRKIDTVPRIQFNLYVNPVLNDRNLEYDQVTNLAPGAPTGVTHAP